MLVVVAGVGRRPFAQVLRNSLSGHPPTTGHGTFFSFTPVVDYRVIVMGIFLDNLAGDKRVIYLNINTLR